MAAIFPDDIFKYVFVNENENDIPALVQIVAWRRPGDKPLSGPMIALFTDTYMCHSAS